MEDAERNVWICGMGWRSAQPCWAPAPAQAAVLQLKKPVDVIRKVQDEGILTEWGRIVVALHPLELLVDSVALLL